MNLQLSDELKKRVNMGDLAISARMILYCLVVGVILCSGYIPQTFMIILMVVIVLCFLILGIVNPAINIELYRIVSCIEKGEKTKALEKMQLLAGRVVPKHLIEELHRHISTI